MKQKRVLIYTLAFLGIVGLPHLLLASGGESAHSITATFLSIAIILIAAKVSGLVEKIGQPAVLGELVIGVILGNLALVGFHFFDPIKEDSIIKFLAELGVVILLFQIGLESNIQEMKKVGMNAFLVAVVGVVAPFVLGTYVVGPWLLPGLDQVAYLFLGASMTATSVGITARVFKDLKKLQTREAQVVLGAAVIDDVLGLIILAIVTAIATTGAVSAGVIGAISAKAILFLVGAIVIGQLIAPFLGKYIAKIQTGQGMKFTLAIAICLIFAWAASAVGLAAIVGAFAAGLILDPVHFRYFKDPKIVRELRKLAKEHGGEYEAKVEKLVEPHAKHHIEDLIEPVAFLLVPIFFVFTGMEVNLETLADPSVLWIAVIISLLAMATKVVAGIFAGKGANKLLVGLGMIPRGEVGLIFASIGKGLGVVSDEVFSIIVIMVIVTTLVTPPFLANILKKQS